MYAWQRYLHQYGCYEQPMSLKKIYGSMVHYVVRLCVSYVLKDKKM